MPTTTRTGKNLRHMYQVGGAKHDNPVKFGGMGGQLLTISSTSNPSRGSIDPVSVHDPANIGEYLEVARSISVPDLPSADVMFKQYLKGIPVQLARMQNCPVNFYVAMGECNDLSTLSRKNPTKIYSNGLSTDQEEGGTEFDSDDPIHDTLSFTFDGKVYMVSDLGWGENTTPFNVVDLVFGSRIECGACSGNFAGDDVLYALVDGNGTDTAPTVVARINGTSTTVSITTASATDRAKAIEVVGQYLVVVLDNSGETQSAIHYSPIDVVTGKPTVWASTTAGISANNLINDIYVESPVEVYFAADNGIVFLSTNIPQGVSESHDGSATTEDLLAIDGYLGTIVAVGTNGAVTFSENSGDGWTLSENLPSLNSLVAVQVKNQYYWIVADGAGGSLHITNVQGKNSWDTVPLPASSTVTDLVMATDEVGYAVSHSGGAVQVWTTISGWSKYESEQVAASGYSSLKMAVPRTSNPVINSNAIAIGMDNTSDATGAWFDGNADIRG